MQNSKVAESIFSQHDHQHCIDQALAAAKELCRQRKSRLTPVRERVLELIWQSHLPLGAYQLLNQLSQEGFNSAPPTVYRALDFLLDHGLIHRIASLNAFIGCNCPQDQHHGYFLICRDCGSAQEIEAEEISSFLRQNASAAGFKVETETVELSGLCPQCQNRSQQDDQ
ncbi:MAG: transcriptional repressor [Motiliproteus sp.]|nr:transcriptional repressor [Motiliproteus sp.]MCW9052469.1 transcriptional repressor [Motiliproteus sp.]